MKKIWFTFTLLLFLFQNSWAQDLYNPDGITLIEITFEDANWDQQLDDLFAVGNDRLLATVEINGESFDSVGIRYRGGATYDAAQGKNPFNIKLDFIKNHDYDGYETLKLNNGAKDPSFVREVLGFDIANQYMPSPHANFAKVFVNGNFHGMYSNIENVDKNLMARNFYSDRDNSFLNCSPDNNIAPPGAGCTEGLGSSLQYLGTDQECYTDYYDRLSDLPVVWTELATLANDIAQNANNIESSINIDRAIWMFAMNNLVVNLDSYLGAEPSNYYLFKDDNDRFNSFVWDFNETFGGDQELDEGQSDLTLSELQNLDPLLRSNDDFRPLLKMILQNPRYKRQYVAHYRTMLNEMINSGWYATRLQELVNLISTDYTNDPNKIYTVANFNDNLNNTVTINYNGSTVDIPGIAELMNNRLTYLLGHTEFMKTPPSISNIGHLPLNVVPNTTITITAEVSGADYVYVGYRDNLTQVFQKEQMYDDGNHDDGAAGDGMYGGFVPIGIEGVEYYIYAEDSGVDVGVFSPERAEEVFYTLSTYGDVVINELMASNMATIADQDGEFDDWVELYNNTSTAINLNGYYLSDDPNDLMKYQFPNVTIDGNGFIVVWLDNDLTQQGLHADFKLSATGEELLLINSNLQVVDKVVFGSQTTDVSYARVPNGTGLFQSVPPTFNTFNQNPSSVSNLAQELGLKIYPNPATEFLVIEMESEELIQVDLWNALGQKVRSFNLDGKRIEDVSDLERGMYWLSSEGSYLGKVVLF